MPRYMSLHSLACLTRQGAEQLAARLHAAGDFSVRQIWVNMTEAKMWVEAEASSREQLANWFEREKFHFDWLMRVEWEDREGKLIPVE